MFVSVGDDSVTPARLLAYGDESIRRVGDGSMVYVFAAVVIPETACAGVRAALAPLAPVGQKLHWRDENQARREAIAAVLAGTQLDAVVLVGAMVSARKQERSRRHLLGRLLWELDQRHVSVLTLESRHHERDRHDIHAVGGFRNAGHLSRRLRVDHGLPAQEPLLWAADAVAGAVVDERTGNPTNLTMLAGLVQVIDVGTAG